MITSLLSIFLSFQIPLEPVDPDLHWQTKHTENFRIHYPEELETVATRLSLIAEPIHRKLTDQMRWKPAGPVHVILLNNIDTANGFSTPLPYNSIYLNISPPEAGSSLDSYDEWLTILFSHEYTHTIHVDMAHGINAFLRLFLGRAIVPNAAQPQWLLEGFAVYNESLHTTAGRGRSSLVEMHLRSAALRDELLPISRATYWNDIYPFGNAAYWYGVRFYNYVADKYGAEKWVDFAHKNASWIVPGWFNFKTREIFGKSFSRMWSEWQEEEKVYWLEKTADYKPQFKSQRIGQPGMRLTGQSCWSPTENKLFAVTQSSDDRIQLVSLHWAEDSDKPKVEILEKSFSRVDLHCQADALYYSKLSTSSPYNQFSDIWRYNLKTKKQKRLTRGLRLRDPFVVGDYIYAVRTAALESAIVRIPLPKEALEENENAKAKNWKALENPNLMEVLFKTDRFSTISLPQVSEDGEKILFSMFRENDYRDLYLLRTKSKEVSRLTSDPYLDYFPQWISENEILFVSDRPQGKENIRVFNVFQLKLSNSNLRKITDTWTGVYWPRAKERELVIGHFADQGFRLEKSSLSPIEETTLIKEPAPQIIPPILAEISPSLPSEVKSTEYKIGTSLFPHYLIPIGYYTEDDSLIGALTGSNDPLGFHRWVGLGYYVVIPKRPGGALSYSYLGFGSISWNILLSAGISNYGRIYIAEQDNKLDILNQDYYERSYRASTGISYQLWNNQSPTNFYFSHDIFFTDYRPLLTVPDEALRDPVQLVDGRIIQTFPDTGQQVGISTTALWSSGIEREIQGIAPYSGRRLRLDLEYSPKLPSMDFHTFTTSLTYKEYFEFVRFHSIALFATAGVQWIDQLYQSTFRLGGSLGETPLSVFNRRNVPLRGLPSTYLRGEGMTAGSLEYRFPILRQVPGWGTAPVWFKNFYGVGFSDLGQTFQIRDESTALQLDPEDFSWKRFTASLGAELRSDVSLYYGPPVSFRLGYGRVLFLEGERVKGPRIDEVYFQLGSSF